MPQTDVHRCSEGVKYSSFLSQVLWGGKVVHPVAGDVTSLVLDTLNKKLHLDERIDLSMLTVGDGLTVAVRR